MPPATFRETSRWMCAGTGGFSVYVPVRQKSDMEELRAALREAQEGLVELRRATGLSKEELVEEFVPDTSRERGREHIGGKWLAVGRGRQHAGWRVAQRAGVITVAVYSHGNLSLFDPTVRLDNCSSFIAIPIVDFGRRLQAPDNDSLIPHAHNSVCDGLGIFTHPPRRAGHPCLCSQSVDTIGYTRVEDCNMFYGDDFDWDDDNVEHIARHGVAPWEVEATVVPPRLHQASPRRFAPSPRTLAVSSMVR
jgi:hypothetical protein